MTTPLPLATIDWGTELGLSWGDLLLVVLAATGIYLVSGVPAPIAAATRERQADDRTNR